MLLTKSILFALAATPFVQASPVAEPEVHIVYKTVTVLNGEIVGEIPTGISFGSPSQSSVASFSHHHRHHVLGQASAAPGSNGYDEKDNETASFVPTTLSTSVVSAAIDESLTSTVDQTIAKEAETSTTSTTSPVSTGLTDPSIVHNGIATFYSVGADNCGTSSTDSDYVCAISQQLYNTVANSYSISEYCGHSINITYGSKTIQVKVVDSCASCDANHLDLSPTAFQALADPNLGVIDITWEWAN